MGKFWVFWFWALQNECFEKYENVVVFKFQLQRYDIFDQLYAAAGQREEINILHMKEGRATKYKYGSDFSFF